MSEAGAWLQSPPVRTALGRVGACVEEQLSSTDVTVRAMASALVRRGGKRIRPALLLLTVELAQPDDAGRAEALRAAAALEMLHIASLYHDDVMDRATQRRHGPSVNAQWGERAAVLAGSFMVARAVQIIAEFGSPAGAVTARALTDLCSGQLLESENAFNTGLTEDGHRTIIALKTATLFELPFRLGAEIAGLDARVTGALVAYGHDLGVAFQMVDDALDIRGTAQALGKRPLSDVREGVYTLSLLRVLAHGGLPAADLRRLLALAEPTGPEMLQVAALVRDSGALDDVLAEARALTREAATRLGELPEGPVRDSLELLATVVVERAR